MLICQLGTDIRKTICQPHLETVEILYNLSGSCECLADNKKHDVSGLEYIRAESEIAAQEKQHFYFLT